MKHFNQLLRSRFALLFVLALFSTPLLGQDQNCDIPPGNQGCDDGNPCTIDIKDGAGNCFHIVLNCDDGDPLTQDSCDPATGQCVNTPLVCNDDDPTTEDVIDIEGNCRHFKKVCDDGDPQTRNYFDSDGNCISKMIVCDDGDPLTDDYLDENGVCHHVKIIVKVEECDECPDDPDKDEPGICGCGNPEPGTPCDDGNPKTIDDRINEDCECEGLLDTDGDGTIDDEDRCPTDSSKTEPGECGCGVPDQDIDGDGNIDCEDMCPDDPDKTSPGACGCGNPDTDSDGDGTPDCNDWCPDDPNKTEDGQCGCGNEETDSDGDGTPDCNDWCPDDPNKTEDDLCGCGNPEPGTPCDDGDDCTTDDRINEDCECVGVPKNTPDCGGEACVEEIGSSCDDGDPCTVEDQINEDCECEGSIQDSDGDGTPDCDDPCPDDPNDLCQECPNDLENCDSYVNFIDCDQVIVCLAKDISNIVVDLGPTGFQSYDVDTKFDGLDGKKWTYTAPEGETINGVWVKTAAFCGKCTDDEEQYGCIDCEGDACPQGNGSGPYYENDNICDDEAAPALPLDETDTNGESIDLDLFPNPTSHLLFIKLKNAAQLSGSVQVLNTNGDVVFNIGMAALRENMMRIDVGNLPYGLYFLRVILEDGRVITKPFVLAE